MTAARRGSSARLQELTVADFRNYEDAALPFGDFNLFLGPNAQGKTNLLEAIHLLAFTRSHRAAADREMVRHEQQTYYVRGDFHDGTAQRRIEIAYDRSGRKQVSLDGKPQAKFSNVVGLLKIVFFAPETTAVVRGAPEDRRRFLDALLSQAQNEYLRRLIDYRKALAQRNEALKQVRDRELPRGALRAWSEPLVSAGTRVIETRAAAAAQLRPLLQEQHRFLTDGNETADLAYRPNVQGENIQSAFEEKIAAGEENDIRRGTTSAGPHRDDLRIAVNQQSARTYGSQGQQRTLTLALKLSEFLWVKETTGTAPIALLDDVMSELDRRRSQKLFAALEALSPQVFLTATEVAPELLQQTPTDIWNIREGTARLAADSSEQGA